MSTTTTTLRHYPELHNPVAPTPRSKEPSVSQQELADVLRDLNRSLANFTQRINTEFRFIVDQLNNRFTTTGNEIVGGNIDGSNNLFVLAKAPNPPESLLLFNRTNAGPLTLLVQGPTFDYVVTDTSIVIVNPAVIPVASDQLVAWYRCEV